MIFSPYLQGGPNAENSYLCSRLMFLQSNAEHQKKRQKKEGRREVGRRGEKGGGKERSGEERSGEGRRGVRREGGVGRGRGEEGRGEGSIKDCLIFGAIYRLVLPAVPFTSCQRL